MIFKIRLGPAQAEVAKNFMKGCGSACTLLTIKTKTAADISEITFYGNEKEPANFGSSRI